MEDNRVTHHSNLDKHGFMELVFCAQEHFNHGTCLGLFVPVKGGKNIQIYITVVAEACKAIYFRDYVLLTLGQQSEKEVWNDEIRS